MVPCDYCIRSYNVIKKNKKFNYFFFILKINLGKASTAEY